MRRLRKPPEPRLTGTYSGFPELVAVERYLGRYTSDIVSKMARHFSDCEPVLEFGAGIGTLAAEWQRQTGVAPECLEIDPTQQQVIRDRGFRCFPSLSSVDKQFSGIYVSNVLEHVEDDRGLLQQLHALLLKDGMLAIYVPAFMCLYSRFDHYLGHHRRYRRSELIGKVAGCGFTVVECRYVDSIGFLAWYGVKLLGKSPEGADLPSPMSLRFYDAVIYPVSKTLDSLLMKTLVGKNLLLIARK
jgi:SAM-dependent methyltransferase